MTCRHAKGDPNCSSTRGGYAQQRIAAERLSDAKASAREKVEAAEARVAELLARTPNPDDYTITRHAQVGAHLVVEVQYSSCKECSFDSRKVMVFLHTNAAAAMYWRHIDPHFREYPNVEHAQIVERDKAPAPRARFPADAQGWKDALEYCKAKS